ncbi:nuclear pore complex protein Nup155 [Sinocyclocheilus grahami]|uniref:nuclear pore complex protein Nup155 n=1 Tax=Sinocyclocheilus grahami TaxID=75366 RepID=UPI0007ACDA80|nr:PREDICTED: nuclear pore complex protein Nup155-like [Sinocyclocheilus grahami]
MPSSLGSSSPAAVLQEALENSSRLIDRHLQEDRCFPDLSELLNIPSHNMPSLSGVSDMDYPLQGPGLISVPSLPELSAIRRVPLPPELVEQFGHMQCNCMMGVFPEISRAWLTIDNDIFMWNYEDGSDVAYFDGLSETILSVGLVKPKPGIFQPHIHFLLVLATPVDVVILGLSFPKAHTGLNDSMSGAMQLLPDPLYSIPTDNTYLLAITSTDVGRVFMAGKDGCLYEIAYQAEAGWFSQRCRKINHSKSSLSFLIPSLLQFSFSEDDPVVQIAVDNSRNILYTRSEKGVLQVYDLGADGQGMSRVAAMSQSSIVSAAGNIARTIDRSVFKPIVQIAVIDRPESSDCQLLAVTHAGVRLYFSTIPFAPPNAKHISARPCLLALVHVRLPPGFSASSTLQKPAKVHKALYSKGVLLMAASEAEDSDVLWCINHDSFPFKKPLMEAQCRFMNVCFLLLCVNMWLTHLDSLGMFPPTVSTPYIPATPMSMSGAVSSGPEVIFSGKHNGISIYFTRILGNIWDGSLSMETTITKGRQTVTILESTASSSDLEVVLLELQGLKEFLDKNSQFSPTSLGVGNFSSPANLQQRLLGFMRPDGSSSQQVQQELQRKYHTEAQAYEKASLQAMQQLVHRSYQTLALWKLLCDHQFSLIVSEMPKEFQDQIKAVSFKDVVVSGRELSGALVTALINVYIKDSACVDTVSAHLRDICPLLYSSDDSICSKANELLQGSRQIQNKLEKERTLKESLRLYQQISHHTDLPLVCSQYRQVRFYEGVVELCLTAADKKDPQKLGLHFYRNGEPEEDSSGLQAFQERLSCYKCITDTMQELVNQSKAAPQSPSVPKQPGPPVMTSDPNMLSNEDAAAHFEQMLGLAQRSQDELFHIALYNWLIQADLTDKLLEVNSPYLEDHLMHMIKQDQSKVRNMDLLWRYYEKNRSFGKAAHVLARLADMHSTEISLKLKILLIPNVVRIQVQIQETLRRQYSQHPSVQGAITQLDSELMDITKLYGEFADHFRLSECKLAIIHCDPCWQRLKKPLHLVECIHVLLSGYVNDPSRVPTYDRRRFTNACLDNICGYLVELQSLSPNAALQDIIRNFKCLQAKLEKLH